MVVSLAVVLTVVLLAGDEALRHVLNPNVANKSTAVILRLVCAFIALPKSMVRSELTGLKE
jgi:hypothetical protein